MENNVVGRNLKEARLYLGLTDIQVARILHYTTYEIIAIEDGLIQLTEADLSKFSLLYKVSLEDLKKPHNYNLSKDEKAIAELLQFKESIKNEKRR